MRKSIREYNQGLVENWKIVLGERWYLTFLSVYFDSRLPHDGTNFVKQSQINAIVAKEL